MSEPTAIGAVTAVLLSILQGDLSTYLEQSFDAVARPPSRIVPPNGAEPAVVNLFLYQVTPNPGWRNEGLPSRGASGDRLTSPPLVLDLHYLLAAYGPTDLLPELLLGRAMQTLHERPVIGHEAIRAILKPPAPNDQNPGFRKHLALSALADQLEQLRVTLEPLTLDDLSKLWTACQAPARPMAAYKVTTVMIESRRSGQSALPVRAPAAIAVRTFDRPVIDRIEPAVPGGPIAAGSRITVSGRDLSTPGLRLVMGDQDVTALVQPGGSDRRVELALPDPLGASFRAGVQLLRAVVPPPSGGPAWQGKESPLAPFVLQPRATVTASGAATTPEGGLTLVAGTFDATLDPPVERGQRVRILLNETPAAVGRGSRAFTFAWAPPASAPQAPAPIATVAIPFSRVPQGHYLVRLEVDGAESPLTAGPAGYTGPEIVL